MGRIGRWIFLLVGLAVFALLLTQVDLGAVRSYIGEMGWGFPLIFLPYVAVYLCDTLGWRFSFGRPPAVPFRTLFLIRTAGEAINNLTPFAYMGGEPIKAHLLVRCQIPIVEGMAASILAKLIMTIAQFLFVALGGILAVSYLVERAILWGIGGILLAAAVLLVGLVRGLQRGMFVRLHRLLARWRVTLPLVERWREQVRRLDETISAMYRHHRQRLVLALSLHLLGWVLGALEVLVIFAAVGRPIGFREALAIEALASVAKGVAFFIPGSLGVQEGGIVLLFAAFGFSSGLGLTFSLVRRIREVLWISFGLLVLFRYYGWSWGHA
jgi:putative membrane protein